MKLRAALAFVAGIFIMATALRAEDWTTRDGQVYHDVKVLEVKPDYVTILHRDGGGRVALANLPADLQKRFNYDPLKAAVAAQATAQADAANQKAMNSEMTVAETAVDASSPPTEVTAPSAPHDTTDTGDLFVNDRSAGPAPANPSHVTINDVATAGQQMRPSLSDPNYHTMARLSYMVNKQGLGPNKNDPSHHTIDDIDK